MKSTLFILATAESKGEILKMDWLGIVILIVVGFIVLRVVGTILKFVITAGLILLFIYIIMRLVDSVMMIPSVWF
ncbi:hypothetical protein [Alteribacter aurantiacus]|uniref:hypothetical protein n=1 Tax=Alteribacter aurantiacus TaxID=254410 RepID=UPI0012EB7A51|nr:hypothetical protein [Alteribacter aurantiacus]